MNGRQSFLLNDIKTQIRNGGNVSHILNVKVSNQRNAEEGNLIRQRIFQAIGNKNITLEVNGMQISICWKTSARTTSAYYHCDVAGMLGDMAVKEHTKLLLRRTLHDIDPHVDTVFSRNLTGVAFLVTKPLVREVVLFDDDDVDAAAHENDHHEAVDELNDTTENV